MGDDFSNLHLSLEQKFLCKVVPLQNLSFAYTWFLTAQSVVSCARQHPRSMSNPERHHAHFCCWRVNTSSMFGLSCQTWSTVDLPWQKPACSLDLGKGLHWVILYLEPHTTWACTRYRAVEWVVSFKFWVLTRSQYSDNGGTAPHPRNQFKTKQFVNEVVIQIAIFFPVHMRNSLRIPSGSGALLGFLCFLELRSLHPVLWGILC